MDVLLHSYQSDHTVSKLLDKVFVLPKYFNSPDIKSAVSVLKLLLSALISEFFSVSFFLRTSFAD